MPKASDAMKSRNTRRHKTESQKLYEALCSNNLEWLNHNFGSNDGNTVPQQSGGRILRNTRSSRIIPHVDGTANSGMFFFCKYSTIIL